MKECGIVALWQGCSGTGIFLTEHRNTQYTVCLIFRRTTCYAVKLTLHKSHSKILWQNICLTMGVFYKKNNRLSCCLWLQPLLTQKKKGLFFAVWISGNKTCRRKIILFKINILICILHKLLHALLYELLLSFVLALNFECQSRSDLG